MRWAEIEHLQGAPSYRQLDYWTARGYITAEDDSPGSGRCRNWHPEQVDRAMRLKALADLGLRMEVSLQVLDMPTGRPWKSGSGVEIYLTT
jgi:DNA-binding transcriptional MerR regulator